MEKNEKNEKESGIKQELQNVGKDLLQTFGWIAGLAALILGFKLIDWLLGM
jgi:hypothetical protein